MNGFVKCLLTFFAVLLIAGTAAADISSPDGYGYVYRDGNSAMMSSISGSGTKVTWFGEFGSHDYSDTKIPLGFSFTYYGVSYDSIYVMTAGWLSFVSRINQLPTEAAFPYDDDCEGVIAPLAITFDLPDVYYETQGTAPNRTFIVEWSGALTPDFVGFDFQAVFHEAGSRIEFMYDNLADDGWGEPTADAVHVGIESPDETMGFEYVITDVFNLPGLPTQYESILFGTRFAMVAPFNDTVHAGSFSVSWTELSGDSSASIALYYDDGTDTTGTLITAGLTKQGADTYSWDGDGVIGLGTAVHMYGVYVEGTDTVVSYAPGTVAFKHGSIAGVEITAVIDTVALADTARYTALATDVYGNTWDTTAGSWSTEGAAVRAFSDGRFVPDVTGTYSVIVSRSGAADTVALYVDESVPVELSSFSASLTDGGVVLAWTTESETDNLGFNVLRSPDAAGPFNKVNTIIIPGAGTTAEPQAYAYADAGAAGTVYYVLEQVDAAGTRHLSGAVSVDAGTASLATRAAGHTEIPAGARLFDAAGRPVVEAGTGVYLMELNGTLVKKLIVK